MNSTLTGCGGSPDAETAAAVVQANTRELAPPLCPELRLALWRDDAPLAAAAPLFRGKPHLFHPEGPRPYWAFAWASGQALARYVLDHPEAVRGRRVLDLGTGSGIAAIAAARAGAADVVAADLDPRAVAAAVHNAALNGVRVRPLCGDVLRAADPPSCDLLLAADAFYGPNATDAVRAWCAGGVELLLADPPCRGFPKEDREELARYAVRTFPEIEHADLESAAVYRLRLAPGAG